MSRDPDEAAPDAGPDPGPDAGPATADTVEGVVRAQLAKALGGRRGMVEAAVPTILFTLTFVTTHDLRAALVLSVAVAVVLLVVRIVQRSQVQFVVNALVGIGIGALFAYRSLRSGGDGGDAALAYFLPGLLYNAVYAAVLSVSNLARWPVVGFLVGSVTGDPTGWRADPRVLRLCQQLTWMLVLPCLLRVAVQAPLYLAGTQGWAAQDAMVAALGVAKVVLGWPLQVAALAGMVWLLARNHTPIDGDAPALGAALPARATADDVRR